MAAYTAHVRSASIETNGRLSLAIYFRNGADSVDIGEATVLVPPPLTVAAVRTAVDQAFMGLAVQSNPERRVQMIQSIVEG